MAGLKQLIEDKLQELCECTLSDFAGLALLDEHSKFIYWKYVYGNCSDRYKYMVGKPGKDISGHVVRFGRLFIIDMDTPNHESKRLEYPIMLAEKLRSTIALPIIRDNKTVGVLALGSRSIQRYSVDFVENTKKHADEITKILYDIQNESN